MTLSSTEKLIPLLKKPVDFCSKMVFQINPFLEDEAKDFKLFSQKYNENKAIKALSEPSQPLAKKSGYGDELDLDELLKNSTNQKDSVVSCVKGGITNKI